METQHLPYLTTFGRLWTESELHQNDSFGGITWDGNVILPHSKRIGFRSFLMMDLFGAKRGQNLRGHGQRSSLVGEVC